MNKPTILSTLTLALFLLAASTAVAEEKVPAFPGAEGFGRYVTGGRGGKVYHVKNLNDAGAYSLRWCLQQQGAKTIVFDVSGTIFLESALSIPSNTTIAGQTAPGDGICVADYPCNISGSNVIVRYMRFRLGNRNVSNDGTDGWDGFGGFDRMDWIIDHCSVSWSIDECLSVLGNKNTTVQWCLVAQSLVNSGHPKGAHGYGGNWGGNRASFHHNLIAHHSSRTPRLGPRPTTQLSERMDMRNNVIYNFGGNGCYGGEGMTVNIVNNYYKPGPGSPTGDKGKRIAGIGVRTSKYVSDYPDYAPALHLWGKYYVAGNYNSKYTDVNNNNWQIGVINQVNAGDTDGTWTQTTRDTIKLSTPMDFVLTTTHTAQDAYARVLDYAGASLHRDSFDELMVSDTRSGRATYTGKDLSSGFINTQDDNKPAGAPSTWSAWPTLNSTEAPVDTDKDGMPDAWEEAHGLNPNSAKDGNLLNEEGYTNLEVYLNSLVEDITNAQNEGGVPDGYIIEEGKEVVEYIIDQQSSYDNGTFASGLKMSSFSNSSPPAYGKNATIKFSSGKQYSVTIPDGVEIGSVTIYGYGNDDSTPAYLSELGGTQYGPDDYVFPARNASPNYAQYTIQLAAPVTKKLTFTASGTQACLKLTLNLSLAATGIGDASRLNDKGQMINDKPGAVYDLQGRRINGQRSMVRSTPGRLQGKNGQWSTVNGQFSKGVYIVNNKKIILK